MKKLLAENDKLWQNKMGKALASFKQKISTMESKNHGDKKEKHSFSQSDAVTMKELKAERKKYEQLKKVHDQEVKDVFKDESTHAFIKKMRSFKKQWSETSSMSKRKATAAAMAETTKAWMSNKYPEEE